jgi:hypothetical protein
VEVSARVGKHEGTGSEFASYVVVRADLDQVVVSLVEHGFQRT